MDYLSKWFDNLTTRPSTAWKTPLTARGECRRHTGPSLWYAAVSITISPDDQLVVEDTLRPEVGQRITEAGWYDQIVFGVLDVLLTHPREPITHFRLTILEVGISEIESNAMAFRLAARDAAAKALEALAHSP